MHGEWWRLWTAHFTHFKHSQLLINGSIMAVMGMIAGRFAKIWQLLLCFIIAMPIITGLLLLTSPHLLFYRGACGITAMMWMIATWFLIVESKPFSLGCWLGIVFLLLFIAKAGLEGLLLLSPSAHHSSSLNITWLIQFFGAMVGLAFFNGLHQLHVTKSGANPQYRGPYKTMPPRPNRARRR